jgi:Flp pilus assembly protein TadD
MLFRFLCSALLLLAFATPAWAVKRGDVVVIRQDADLKISGKVVGKVKAGDVSRVHSVRGAWVEVGETPRGWVRTDNVLTEDEGLAHVTELLDKDPKDATLLITRARMHLSLASGGEPELSQRLKSAESDLREAQRRSPENADVRYYQAQVELRRNDAEAALRKLNEAIDLNTKDGRYFAERGRLLERKQDRAGSLQDYEKAADLGAADAYMFNNLAWSYATSTDSAKRDGTKAVKYATRACELTHYDNYMYVDTLAAACAEDSDFPSAIRWQKEAIRICNDPIEKRRCEERLKMYQLNQPYRE